MIVSASDAVRRVHVGDDQRVALEADGAHIAGRGVGPADLGDKGGAPARVLLGEAPAGAGREQLVRPGEHAGAAAAVLRERGVRGGEDGLVHPDHVGVRSDRRRRRRRLEPLLDLMEDRRARKNGSQMWQTNTTTTTIK